MKNLGNFYENWDKKEHYGHPVYCSNTYYNAGGNSFYDDFIKFAFRSDMLPVMNNDLEVYQFTLPESTMYIVFLFSSVEDDCYNTVVFDRIPVDCDFLRIIVDAGRQKRGLPPMLPETKLHKFYYMWLEEEVNILKKERPVKADSAASLEDFLFPVKKNPYYPFLTASERYHSFSNFFFKYWSYREDMEDVIPFVNNYDLTKEEYHEIIDICSYRTKKADDNFLQSEK